MKETSTIFLFLLISSVAFAQSRAEKQVSSAVEALRAAMISGDRKALEDITATHLSYGHSAGKMEDRATFIESLASGKSDILSMDLSDQQVIVHKKTALVRHKFSARINDNGIPGLLNLGVLLVFQKQGQDWRLLARQAFKLPQK